MSNSDELLTRQAGAGPRDLNSTTLPIEALMSDHAGTNPAGRLLVLSGFCVILAAACAAPMNAGGANRQTTHPCNALRASLALDTAKFGIEGELGELIVGAYTVEGLAAELAFLTLTPLQGYESSADTLAPRYFGRVSPEGLSHFARVDPGRYRIHVRSIGFEEQTQNLEIIPARPDTVCFVMRRMRLYFETELDGRSR